MYKIFNIKTMDTNEIVQTSIGEKKKCKSCSKFTTTNWWMLLLSFYILFAAVYGTIKLFREISTYF